MIISKKELIEKYYVDAEKEENERARNDESVNEHLIESAKKGENITTVAYLYRFESSANILLERLKAAGYSVNMGEEGWRTFIYEIKR